MTADTFTREEFPLRVRETLSQRVGLRCSNPFHGQLTSGPRSNPSLTINIGVAAHITAASAGGPRYDSSLSRSARSAAENGIWLCQNCAKLVDNDPLRYTATLLRSWKAQAEATALLALESRHHPPESVADALAEIRQTLQELTAWHRPPSPRRWQHHSGATAEEAYLREAFFSAGLLQCDAPLASDPHLAVVAVDLKDIHDYMAMTHAAALLPEQPIIDYCLETSPIRLSLPPGAALQLQHLLDTAVPKLDSTNRPLNATETQILSATRDEFLTAYDAEPGGLRAGRAHERLIEAWAQVHSRGRAHRVGVTLKGVMRIGALFSAGRLRAWSGPPVLHDELLMEFYRRFEVHRPRSPSNTARALDMAAIARALELHNGNARFLSSGFSLHAVAEETFNTRSPVRTPREYGLFVQTVALASDTASYNTTATGLSGSIDAMITLLPEVRSCLAGDSSPGADVLDVLERFADFYRTVLRPVDRMLEASSGDPTLPGRSSMEELYVALTQGDLSAAFHAWWERLCTAVAEVQDYIGEVGSLDEIQSFLNPKVP